MAMLIRFLVSSHNATHDRPRANILWERCRCFRGGRTTFGSVGRSAVGGSGQGLINRLDHLPGFSDEIVEHKAARRPTAGPAASSGWSTSSIALPFKPGEFARRGLVAHHVTSQPDFL
jgi:hypothetical protein